MTEEGKGPELSGEFQGPVVVNGGEAVDARGSKGMVYKPSGPVNIYSRSQQEELNDYLVRAVAAYEARMYQYLRPPTAPPEQPYKFLYAFEIEDAPIFFGRDDASEALHKTVLRDKMTVLHAKSGAGKTSLLKAGLSPRLIREGRLPVYARVYEDPVLAIKRAIAPPSQGPWPELLPILSLHEFLGLACKCLSEQTEEFIIILDQFEEFFVFWPEPKHRRPFVEVLAICYEDLTLPVRFVIGIRGDYFTHLATFQNHLSHIFHNEYYLDLMTREEAQKAITEPVSRLDREVGYEAGVLDIMLDDLGRGGIELPHLQIVCTQIYEALNPDEIEIIKDHYEKLGQVEGMLARYLKAVLDRLPSRQELIAKQILKEMVSSEATKRVLSDEMLTTLIKTEQDELDSVLICLVNARLLRRDEIAGQSIYEIAHEVLIHEIQTWLDQADLALKQAEEMLEREIASWRAYGMLIPKDRLEKLHPYRERLRFDDDIARLLIYSSLVVDSTIADWAVIAGNKYDEYLEAALNDHRQAVRLAALRELGNIWEVPEVSLLGSENRDTRKMAVKFLERNLAPYIIKPLVAAILDEDREVRWLAVAALGKIGNTHAVEALITALADEDSNVRQCAVEALGTIYDVDTVDPLISALQDEDKKVRWLVVKALGQLGDVRATKPLTLVLREDDDGDVRRLAFEVLGQFGVLTTETLVFALSSGDRNLRQAIVETLLRVSDVDMMKSLSTVVGNEYVEPLRTILVGEDEDMHWLAAWALGHLGNVRAVYALITALENENSGVRCLAAKALGDIGDARAVDPLIAALSDKDIRVRDSATWALEQIGEPAVEQLITALVDEELRVRGEAIGALRRIGSPRAMAALDNYQE